MAANAKNIVELKDYQRQTELYERNRKIYDDNMRLWDACEKVSSEMDARFDKALFTVAAGSFGVSFAFIDGFITIAEAAWSQLLVASWACFAACLIVMVTGHLISAETWRKQRDEVAKDMLLQYEGESSNGKPVKDRVSPCNKIALISYTGGIICLLWFVLINL